MSTAKRLVKNAFYIFFSKILTKVINVAFVAYSARILGVKYYGIFVLVNSLVFLSQTFTNFGIRPMVIRRISKDKSKAEELLSNILAIRLCLSMVVYFFLLLFVNLYGYSQEIRSLVYIAGIIIVFNVLYDSFGTVYIAFERMKLLGALSVLSSLTLTTLAVIVLAYGFWLKTVFLVNVLVGAAFTLLAGFFIWKRFFRFRPRFNSSLVKDIVIQSVPFFLALLLGTLNRKIDILMLSMINGPIENNLAIGYYAPAHNILFALMMFPISIKTVMLPVVSRKIYSDHDFVKKSVEKATRFVMIVVSFPIILATTFFSKELVTLFFGLNYLQTAPVITILGWSYAFYGLNIPAQSVLGSSKELKEFLPLLFGILLLNVILNYLMIPEYSYIGASIATCAVSVVGFIGRFYFLRKILEIRVSEIKGYLKLLFLLVITIGSVSLVRSSVPWPVLAFLTATVYLFLLYTFKAFEKDEITCFTGWVKKS